MKGQDFKAFLLIFSFLASCLGTSQNLAPTIFAEGEQFYCSDAPMPIVTDVSITIPEGGSDIQEIFIQISEGYIQGQDILRLSQDFTLLSSIWNANEGVLTLSTTGDVDLLMEAIRSITFETTQDVFQDDRIFSINLGSANYLPSTGHYYFYVESLGISWNAARAAAENLDYFGLQGYLATLTTPEEAVLAGEQSSGTGWIGGSDSEQEGVWKWMTGPETGQVFWNGTANGSAPNGAYAFWNAGEPNNCCGGENYAHITDPSIGIPGSWNDLPIDGGRHQNQTDPYTPKGYIVEFGGTPGDPEINLSASTRITTPKLDVSQSVQCGQGSTQFELSTNADHLLWYTLATSSTLLSNDIDFQPTIDQTTTFYVVPVFDGCTEGARIPITATINEIPTATNITIIQCNDGPDDDGISVFDLKQYQGEIVNNESNRTVEFYDDEALQNQIDGSNYVNNFNFQRVFAVVTDNPSGCSAISEITLVVGANNPDTVIFEQCDDDVEDGLTTFDLSQIEDEVLSGSPKGLNVDYFLTYNDALLNQSSLPMSFSTQIPNSQIIVARLSQDDICYGMREVELRVLKLPQIEASEELYYCTDSYPAPISLIANSQGTGSANFTYEWSTGETSRFILIDSVGDYSVTVTSPNGCQKTKTFTVLPSEIATITGIEVRDLGGNNSVSISVTGEGTYQYAIESVAGPYQDSNQFENLRPGFYTVYVRDIKSDCGIIAQSISVIGYPKYFTPNGDGFHDTWSLKGVSDQFQPNSRVLIYNRFGKIVKSLDDASEAWDGNYNGSIMPNSDYWFIGLLQDGRRFKGHFTLKR